MVVRPEKHTIRVSETFQPENYRLVQTKTDACCVFSLLLRRDCFSFNTNIQVIGMSNEIKCSLALARIVLSMTGKRTRK